MQRDRFLLRDYALHIVFQKEANDFGDRASLIVKAVTIFRGAVYQ